MYEKLTGKRGKEAEKERNADNPQTVYEKKE